MRNQAIIKNENRPRILYPDMGLVSSWNIPQALTLNNIDVKLIAYSGTPELRKDEDREQITRAIQELGVDAVMTHDYYVPIALACAEKDVPYISWIYDSIQVALYDDSIKLPCNYIFDFDKLQARETKERGAIYVRHMPLAANPYIAAGIELDDDDEKRFLCDVSFIGSLYKDSEIPNDVMRYLSEEASDEVRELLSVNAGRWSGEPRFAGKLTEKTINEIAEKILKKYTYDRNLIGDRRYIEETLFSRGVTREERIEAVKKLGKTGADVRLFTHNDCIDVDIPGVKINGSLSYTQELPKAYFLSKINLNLTLPSIRSGVPLRVYDIMAAGGFVLTNYQPEIDELFEVGRDLEVFRSWDEMIDKVDYYLKHERERLNIALNGHIKVRDNYSYEKRVGQILEMVNEDLVSKGQPGFK